MRQFQIDSALQRLAERRIEEAMRQGKFENLPGRGQPCDLDSIPVDENARMIWWALRMMRNAGQTPEEVRLRQQVQSLKDELSQTLSETRVRALVGVINSIVKQVNAMPHNEGGPRMTPVDLGRELGQLHYRQRVKVNTKPKPAGVLSSCTNGLCASPNPGAARFCRRCGSPIGVC